MRTFVVRPALNSLTVLSFVAGCASSVRAQTTYTTQTSNFISVTQDNNQASYAGEYNANNTVLGLYANGGDGTYGKNPQVVNFRTLTTDGTNMASAAQSLQVGQSITVTLSASGSNGIKGNSIGFSFNNGTANSATTNYNTGGRFEYSFTGGDSSAAIYAGSGKQTTGLPNLTDFEGGLTYTFTLVSTDEFNFSVSGGTTYNVGTLGGSTAATIDSFSLFNRGYNNNDAAFSNISVSNVGTIGLTANSGETKTVTGVIQDQTTGTNTANSVQKLGTGTVVLQNTNTYTGTTAVNTGTLLVNGSTGASSAVTVASGATLGGNGLVGGATTVNGTLSPGPAAATGSVGVLRVGALTLASTANALFDVNGATTFDKVTVSGALAYRGTLTIDLGNYTPTGTTTYQLFSSNGETGAFTDDASVTFDQSGYSGTFDPTSGNLTITAVPEPGTWLAGCLTVGTALYVFRRRLPVAA